MSILKGGSQTKYYLSFDGVNDYVDLTNNNFAFDNFNSGYVETDVKILSFDTSNITFIVSARDGSTNTRLYIGLETDGELYIALGNSNFVDFNFFPNLNQTYNYRLEWNNGTGQFYVDNNLEHTFSYSVGSGNNVYDYTLGSQYNDQRYTNMEMYSYKHVNNGSDFIVWDNSQDGGSTFVNSAGTNGNIVGATWDSEEISAIENIYYGSTEVFRVYLGGALVYDTTPPPRTYLSFDGVDDYVSFNSSGVSGDTWTVEYTFEVNNINGTAVVVSQYAASATGRSGFSEIRNQGAGNFIGADSGDTAWELDKTGTTIFPDNVKQTVSVVNNNGFVSIYLNGNLEISGNQSRTIGNFDLSFGYLPGFGNYFSGNIYEVRIWDIAISQSKVQEYVNIPININENNLNHVWKFNEGSGNTLNDSVGNKDGTINGATWGEE